MRLLASHCLASLTLAAATVIAACHEAAPPQAARTTGTAGPTISLDSCERLDTNAHAQLRVMAPGESLPAPHTGSWATTRRVSIAGVSLEIPVDVEVDGPNSEGVYALLEFPDCRFLCTLLVLFTPDSTHLGLDGYLHRVHTIGPVRPGDEPPEVPGPPTFFVVDGERAAYMDEPCGDCTSASVVTVHKARILKFNLSLSDQEGYQPGILCRLARVATSLRWEPVQHP